MNRHKRSGQSVVKLSSQSPAKAPLKGCSQPKPSSNQETNVSPQFFRFPRNRDWSFGLLLVIATLIAYWPALKGEFLWDDDSWTSGIFNLVHNLPGLRKMWCDPTALQQYYPLSGTAFWLDYHFWGFRALPYHIENVLLHALAAFLLWRLLRLLQVAGAGLAGAIFALHPLMVESVAWIAERKNTLSLVLYLGAMLAYGRFTQFWKADDASQAVANNGPPRCWSVYALAFFLFLCALLAKATAFSLPATILLICWWKRGRIQWRTDVLPTVPFFMLAVSLSQFTAWLEKHHVGAMGTDWNHSFPERCLIAGRALWFYAGKLVCPVNLCFVYPQWQLNVESPAQWFYPVSAIGFLLALWLARNRIGRGPVAAALFFVGTLFPILGFMNVYFMRYSFVCDHWAYLSSPGLIALSASLIVRIAERLRLPKVLCGVAAVLLLALGVLTWQQCKMYTDVETLWRTTLDRNPACWMAHNNLGFALYEKGQINEAIL
ncbi:MAG: hypothetical protein WB870_05270, partial [Gallionellaceae bacterium]